jgi:hypothetical protein
MRTLSMRFLLAALLLGLAAQAPAQIRRIERSGCPDPAGVVHYPTPSGPAVIGQPFKVACPPSPAHSMPFVVLGVVGHPVAFRPPIACRTVCVLACDPIAVLPGDGWSIDPIPRDPNLVGVCICIQCGSLVRDPVHPPCIVLSGALEVCVERPS